MNPPPPDSKSLDHSTRLFSPQNFASLKIFYAPELESVCERARRGFFRAQNNDPELFCLEISVFVFSTQNLDPDLRWSLDPDPALRPEGKQRGVRILDHDSIPHWRVQARK